MTRAVTDGTERARLAGDLVVYARVQVQDADAVWRELTNFHGVDWFVRAEISANIDDRAMTMTLTLVREASDTDVGHMNLAPQIIASPANHKADTTYAPFINPARKVRVLVDVEAYGDAPLAHGTWKRIFDGKIDSVDPAVGENQIVVKARDRAAWLLNTWIEAKRDYGSDEGAGTPVESVVQDLIDDNPVPFGAVLVVPTSPDFNLGAFTQSDDTSVMEAIYALAALQGADIRYVFRSDGDTDPELLYFVPARDKVVPDWTFGPNEYLELPRATIDDNDVRNAITIDYFDASVGSRQQITRTNAASINAFGRRWGKITVKDKSQIDSATEATALGDAVVSDLSSPPFEHEMRTFLFWPITVQDLVRFQSNSVLYDQNQDLALFGFTHTLENDGTGWTTMQCRGTPAGAYRGWLQLLGGGGPAGAVIHGTYDVIAEDATSITLAVSGTVEGSSAVPVVAWAWSTLTPVVSRISGALQMVFVASGSQWKFAKPNPGAGDGMVGFLVGFDATSSVLLQIPVAEGTAFPSPTIDNPSVNVIDDPTDDFDVDWVVHSMPTGAQYRLFWRFSTGSWEFHPTTTDLFDTITHAEHGQVIAALGTQNAEIQVYVEAYDSFGAHIAVSAVVTKTYHFDGFG